MKGCCWSRSSLYDVKAIVYLYCTVLLTISGIYQVEVHNVKNGSQ